jgi:hypothetical protein
LNLKKDREVHHGEEEKGEETIDQKEEGRSGPQEAQNDEGLSKAVDQEEISAQSCPEAPFGAEACSVDACRGTGADALVEPAQRLRRRWRRRRSLATAQGQKTRRRLAPPPALHSPVGLNSIHSKARVGGDPPTPGFTSIGQFV